MNKTHNWKKHRPSTYNTLALSTKNGIESSPPPLNKSNKKEGNSADETKENRTPLPDTFSHVMVGGGSATMKHVMVTGRLRTTDFSTTGWSRSSNLGATEEEKVNVLWWPFPSLRCFSFFLTLLIRLYDVITLFPNCLVSFSFTRLFVWNYNFASYFLIFVNLLLFICIKS